jgi:hypothetical protein
MGSLSQLEKAPQLIAAVTAVILCMSVVHDAGYFLVIGREYQWFMSPTDYIASAITWLPLVLLSVTLVGMLQLALGAALKFRNAPYPIEVEARPDDGNEGGDRRGFVCRVVRYRPYGWKLLNRTGYVFDPAFYSLAAFLGLDSES